MARLFDCFRPLFSFGLARDAAIAAGRPTLSHEAAQRRALALLEEARKAARSAGTTARQIESASFAVVAWLDEILARHPGAKGGAAPLQVQLFNSNNAASEFFHHLALLQANEGQVREIYWYALVLGFKGQYYFETGDDGELGKLKNLHAQQLPVRPLSLEHLAGEHLTPQPYGAPDPPRARDPRHRRRLRIGAVLVLLAPILYVLWFRLVAHDVSPTLAQRVDPLLQGYACADLAATVDPAGMLRVSGFVAQQADMARVEREVRALPGVTTAQFDFQLRIWPYCEVVALLKPYQARHRDERSGLQIAVASAIDGRLREGDTVRLRVTNARTDGYLRIDYYTADGSVMHLGSSATETRVRAGATLELGGDIPASWLVSPPFGTVLVTVLASPEPIVATAGRTPFELASAYLPSLRAALAANEKSDRRRLVADFVFLETTPR